MIDIFEYVLEVVKDPNTLWSLLKIKLLLGLTAWMAVQLEAVPAFLTSRFKNKLHFDHNNDFYEAFTEWYLENYPQSFGQLQAKLKLDMDSRNRNKYISKISQYIDINYIKYKGAYISVVKDKEENKTLTGSRYHDVYVLTTYLNDQVFYDLIEEIRQYWEDKHQENKGIRVVIRDKWNDFTDRFITTYKPLETVFVDNKDDLLDDIENFLGQESLYERQGIKFKRSYLLHGKPGTGKTSMVFAIADWLNRPVYYLNPAGFPTDASFEDFIQEIEDNSIVLIEEIDVFWQEKKQNKTTVSFQSLLNVLDGINSPNNILLFATTNEDIDTFDKAMMRKGRIDKSFRIGYPSRKMVEGYVSSFYEDGVKLPNYKSKSLPMVDIQDACLKHKDLNQLINKLNK
jgi:ATP-dependent Zn protease